MNAYSEVYKTLMKYEYEEGVLHKDTLLEQIYGNLDRIKFEYDDEERVTGILFKHNDDTDYTPKYNYIYDK